MVPITMINERKDKSKDEGAALRMMIMMKGKHKGWDERKKEEQRQEWCKGVFGDGNVGFGCCESDDNKCKDNDVNSV